MFYKQEYASWMHTKRTNKIRANWLGDQNTEYWKSGKTGGSGSSLSGSSYCELLQQNPTMHRIRKKSSVSRVSKITAYLELLSKNSMFFIYFIYFDTALCQLTFIIS